MAGCNCDDHFRGLDNVGVLVEVVDVRGFRLFLGLTEFPVVEFCACRGCDVLVSALQGTFL